MVAMIAITNPLGNMAIFLGLTASRTTAEVKKSALTMGIAIAFILILMTWAGAMVLGFFGITVPVFQITGGLVILLIGLNMLRPQYREAAHPEKEMAEDKTKENIAVVPMAIPIIAGPGAITTLIIFTHQHNSIPELISISLGVLLITLIITVLFYFSSYVKALIGENGVKISERVMGLVIAAIAMGMIIEGLAKAFPILQ